MQNLSVHCVTNISDFIPYKDDWSHILEKTSNNNPFIEFSWVYLWWKHFGEGQHIEILVVKEEGKVVAFFPFSYKKYGFLYVYHFIAMGQSNYMDIVHSKPSLEPLIEFVYNYLETKKRHIVFYLHGILQSSPTNKSLASYLSNNKMKYQSFPVITPYIDLNKIQMEEYIKKKQKLHRLDRREKRIRENGVVETIRIGSDNLDEIFSLHDKRWKKKSDTSGFTSPLGKKFYSSLVNVNEKALQTQMDGLFFDGKLIAFNYGYRCRDRYTSYVLGFDDDYDVFSPGRILEKEKILQCSQQGTPLFDLSIGYETYKFEWYTDLDYTERFLFSTNTLIAKSFQTYLGLKGKLIELIKKHPKVVLFKRNKVGKLLYLLGNLFDKEEKHEARKIIKDYFYYKSKQLFLFKTYTIYELPRRDVPTAQNMHFNELTMKTALGKQSLFNKYKKEISTKVYGAFRGYYKENEESYQDVVWTNEKVLRIDHISYIKDFRKSSILIDNWKTHNLFHFCQFIKGKSNANNIIIYMEKRQKKEQQLAESLGFKPSYQIQKRTLLGLSKERIITF